jgi:VWFA-related protein
MEFTRMEPFIKRRPVMTLQKKLAIPAAALALLAFLAPASRPQETAPRPATIAVRVFDGGRFVGGLTREDFELQVDGVPQKIEALYEVDKNAVVRSEGETAAAPLFARRFFLLFQMYEYDPKVSEALRYFFSNVLLPGDTLEIQTPVKNYMLTPQAFAQEPKDVLAKKTDDLIRKDINRGNFVYKELVRELRRLIQGIEGTNPVAGGDEASGAMVSQFGLEQMMNQYRESLTKLEAQQSLDQVMIIAFANALKKPAGRKFLFLFCQQEYRPEISTQVLNALIDTNQDNQTILADLHELFQVYHKNISYDVKRVVEAFCDSGADVNFLFMKKTPERFGGINMREQSEDVFKLFSQVAAATGGIAETTQNEAAEIRDAVRTAEMYYLLSFTPAPAGTAGAFQPITVKVKGKDYRVLGRQGFIAD